MNTLWITLRGVMPVLLILSMLHAVADDARITADDLSESARRLLPDTERVDLVLKDGRRISAEIIDETETVYVLRMDTGTIVTQRRVNREDVLEVRPVSIAEDFAAALERFELDPQTTLPADRYPGIIALFDEYLAKFPETEDARWIEERRDAFRAEYQNVLDGLQKVRGEWYTLVQAAVMQYELVTEEMSEMEERFQGIEEDDWDRYPAARRKYDELRDERRAIARKVPRLVTDRTGGLIEEQNFDEAFGEINAFLGFWIEHVMDTEILDMDLDFISRLQHRVMDAYQAAQEPMARPEPENVPEDMVYIPGGYFFMGDPDASSDDDTFPFRVVFVNPFLIDRYEVSNAQYREFYEYVRRTGDYSMSHPSAPPMKDHAAAGWNDAALSDDRQPVVGVDWFDAYAYLNWRRKRLPTEAERELAARGYDGRIYSWGDKAPANVSVNSPAGREYIAEQMDQQRPPRRPQQQSRFSCRRQPPEQRREARTELPAVTWPVDQGLPPEAMDENYDWDAFDLQSINPFGLYHMAGNAAEWVADRYDAQYYQRVVWDNPIGPERGRERIARGGSYLCEDEYLKTFARRPSIGDKLKRGLSENRKPMIGFRGVRDLPLAGNRND